MDKSTIQKGSIKGLGTYGAKLQNERGILLMKLQALQEELHTNQEQITQVEKRIQNLKSKELTVTEHAILRYIERVEAIPPGEVASRILTDKLKELVATLGDGKFPLDGFWVRVKDNVVVTVVK